MRGLPLLPLSTQILYSSTWEPCLVRVLEVILDDLGLGDLQFGAYTTHLQDTDEKCKIIQFVNW